MTMLENQAEYDEVKNWMHSFFEACYTRRDWQAVSLLAAENIMYVGVGSSEVAYNSRDFRGFMQMQTQAISCPIEYFVKDYVQKYIDEDSWNCYALIALRVTSGNWGIVRYVVRLTTTLRRIGGQWKFWSLHVSEASNGRQEREQLPFTTRHQPGETAQPLNQTQIARVLNQLIPGGIINRVNGEGYPLAIANRQFLKMVGYGEFSEYAQDQQGLFLNNIHPDDVEKYIYTARFIVNTDKQYECEYRLRRKDGSYIWVHDVGRKAVSTEGKELLVSVVTDMSEQIERRHRLEVENGIDFLTKVYNRKGAKEFIKTLSNQYQQCIFFIVDLDNFKLVNDLYSHLTGDRVLRYAAELLAQEFNQTGVVCRLGGDEFCVFIPDYDDLDGVKERLSVIADSYRNYLQALCPETHSSMSVGGVYGTGSVSLRTKYQKADANLYKVKNNGKSNMLFTSYDE